MAKPQFKLYLTDEMARKVSDATLRLKAAGRNVSRNEVLTQLIEEGLGVWARESDVISRVEGGISRLLDQNNRLLEQIAHQDQLIRSILLSMADGDMEQVDELVKTIKEKDLKNA